MTKEKVELENGKYELVHIQNSNKFEFKCLRNGEEWRDLIGDKMIFSMFNEMIKLKNQKAENIFKTENFSLNQNWFENLNSFFEWCCHKQKELAPTQATAQSMGNVNGKNAFLQKYPDFILAYEDYLKEKEKQIKEIENF